MKVFMCWSNNNNNASNNNSSNCTGSTMNGNAMRNNSNANTGVTTINVATPACSSASTCSSSSAPTATSATTAVFAITKPAQAVATTVSSAAAPTAEQQGQLNVLTVSNPDPMLANVVLNMTPASRTAAGGPQSIGIQKTISSNCTGSTMNGNAMSSNSNANAGVTTINIATPASCSSAPTFSSSTAPTATSGTTAVFAITKSAQAVATTVSSAAAAQQQAQLNVLTVSNPNPILTNVVLNMTPASRPGGPQNIGVPKTLAPRVVNVIGNPVRIAPQMIQGLRPGAPGQVITTPQGTFALPPNLRGTILVKTENGQLQLVNVSPQGPAVTTAANFTPGAAYRFQMPATATSPMRNVTPQQMTVTLPVSVASAIQKGTQQVQVNQPLTIQTNQANAQAASTPSQMSPNTAKRKCKNFLSTLIRLASDQPEQVATNVKNLIQGLIDGLIQPEEFTSQLQKELNSSPQPCLVPFLKKSLPYLRHSLMIREMAIEGVRPPHQGSVQLPPVQQAIPQIQLTNAPRPGAGTTVRLLTTPFGNNLGPATHLPQGTVLTTQLPQQRLTQPHTIVVTTTGSAPITTTASTPTIKPPTAVTNKSTVKSAPPSKSRGVVSATAKDKDKKNFLTTLRDDDDINDVAAMGGVNLVEESQRILATNAEFVGAQIRSCKDENFLFTSPLHKRINQIAAKLGLEEAPTEVVSLISHAAQERLKTYIEKLGVIAEHRLDNIKSDSRFEITKDVRNQIKFLEELDRLEKKKHEEQEREMLIRAAKSRSKLEDPEQLKLKQKAKEMQRAELEEARQREANETALLAIGPRKKQKLGSMEAPNVTVNSIGNPSNHHISGLTQFFPNNTSKQQVRRVKRVNLRDLQFLMEQERETVRSPLLYKLYAK